MENLEQEIRMVLEDVELSAYAFSFDTGDVLFYEGEDSEDLYILLSGVLEIRKGNVVISHIKDQGALLGELSHVLGIKRTATVSAQSGGRALKVPGGKIREVFCRYPVLAMANTMVLAQRLQETTQAYHGFKEFCDMLPEAVVVFDKEGNITSFNRAAQKALGREWDELKENRASELFPDLGDYRDLVASLRDKPDDAEREVSCTHPEKGRRVFSMKNSLLRNEIGNVDGVIALLRDNTDAIAIQRKYHRFRYAALAMAVALVALGMVLFAYWEHLVPGTGGFTQQQRALEAAIARDVGLLQAQLSAAPRGKEGVESALEAFFRRKGADKKVPYASVMILDPEKAVSASAGPAGGGGKLMKEGDSLAGIPFKEIPDSAQQLLTLYRVDADNPMGVKSLGLAFPLKKKTRHREWLILQLDAEDLNSLYKADEATLERFHFAP